MGGVPENCIKKARRRFNPARDNAATLSHNETREARRASPYEGKGPGKPRLERYCRISSSCLPASPLASRRWPSVSSSSEQPAARAYWPGVMRQIFLKCRVK